MSHISKDKLDLEKKRESILTRSHNWSKGQGKQAEGFREGGE